MNLFQVFRLVTPEELSGIGDNLFVDQELVSVVTANLEEVRKSLAQLKIRLEKVHFAYAGE